MTKQFAWALAGPFVLGALLCCGARAQQQPAAGGGQPSPITGLRPDHATLSVENLDREAEWYERVLGMKVLHRMDQNPDMINQQMAIPGYRIDLIKYKGSTRPPHVNPLYLQQGWIHVVFHVDDLSAAVRQVKALGVDAKINNDDKGAPSQILLHDPEGNEIEVREN
jgi:catechol 2,3-dioxygenase-like lactoylglutathione lyase family enzyme